MNVTLDQIRRALDSARRSPGMGGRWTELDDAFHKILNLEENTELAAAFEAALNKVIEEDRQDV